MEKFKSFDAIFFKWFMFPETPILGMGQGIVPMDGFIKNHIQSIIQVGFQF
jgi:hypothetical protein